MDVKLFEIRDRATFMPMMAIRLRARDEMEFFLLRRSGYSSEQIVPQPKPHTEPYVILTDLNGIESHYDAFEWPNMRITRAHMHIIERWDDLSSGEVIDIEYILRESKAPKMSERLERAS